MHVAAFLLSCWPQMYDLVISRGTPREAPNTSKRTVSRILVLFFQGKVYTVIDRRSFSRLCLVCGGFVAPARPQGHAGWGKGLLICACLYINPVRPSTTAQVHLAGKEEILPSFKAALFVWYRVFSLFLISCGSQSRKWPLNFLRRSGEKWGVSVAWSFWKPRQPFQPLVPARPNSEATNVISGGLFRLNRPICYI